MTSVFIFARIAEEPGNCARYKTVKGYLVKGRSLMHESKLKDSPYLFYFVSGGEAIIAGM